MAYDPALWTTREDKHAQAEALRYLIARRKGKAAAWAPPKHGAKCNERNCHCPKITTIRHSAAVKVRDDLLAEYASARTAGIALADLPGNVAGVILRVQDWDSGRPEGSVRMVEFLPDPSFAKLEADRTRAAEARLMEADAQKILECSQKGWGTPTDAPAMYERRAHPDYLNAESRARILDYKHGEALKDNAAHDAAAALAAKPKAQAPVARPIFKVCTGCQTRTRVPAGHRVMLQRCGAHDTGLGPFGVTLWRDDDNTVVVAQAA